MIRPTRGAIVALITLATFTDIVAYSIAVPVLPDLGRRLGASPTLIGLLFASFGLSVLLVSVPMGRVSDRIGRRLPLLAGAAVLVASTLLFAYADSLPALFGARIVQGAADAVTWVVGFAVIADLYGPSERGRVMGIVMAGANFGFMIGPTIGGWLYEMGGIHTPFVAVAGLAFVAMAGFVLVPFPPEAEPEPQPHRPIRMLLRAHAVMLCAVTVVVVAGTISMLEPVLSFFLADRLAAGPARIGMVFGAAALAAAAFNPMFGRLADRVGARKLMFLGLAAAGLVMPALGRAGSFESSIALFVLQTVAVSAVVTPSLAYMAEAMSASGVASFGVAYGVYNFAWAAGLLGGPAAGGFLYERLGFQTLTLVWGLAVLAAALLLNRASARVAPSR